MDLLAAILDSTPAAMVLVGETGRIAYTNAAARALFFEGQEATGQNFLSMLAVAPEPLRRPLVSEADQIFTIDDETYHVARRPVALDAGPYMLITVRHLTHEIARQEIATLKRTLRIVGHELGNSMAPASSLLRSARQMLDRPELRPRLESALDAVAERLGHLEGFLTGLAQLGRLPRPLKREVAWPGFLDGLRALWPDARFGAPPAAPGWFDPAQIQQVLINLVKNAHEAGGPRDEVAIEIEADDGGVRFSVLDRGPGMTDAVLASAPIPTFTTKARGSGMGLALCRDIVDAHDGRLRLGRRDGGGAQVSFWLPSRTPADVRARLTLTGVR